VEQRFGRLRDNGNRSGTYWVEARTFCGLVRDTVKITFEAPPVVALGADTTMCVGQTLYLSAFHPQGLQYFWQGFAATATYKVTTDGTYQVEVRGRIVRHRMPSGCGSASAKVNC
jgi:hypothetical protein